MFRDSRPSEPDNRTILISKITNTAACRLCVAALHGIVREEKKWKKGAANNESFLELYYPQIIARRYVILFSIFETANIVRL